MTARGRMSRLDSITWWTMCAMCAVPLLHWSYTLQWDVSRFSLRMQNARELATDFGRQSEQAALERTVAELYLRVVIAESIVILGYILLFVAFWRIRPRSRLFGSRIPGSACRAVKGPIIKLLDPIGRRLMWVFFALGLFGSLVGADSQFSLYAAEIGIANEWAKMFGTQAHDVEYHRSLAELNLRAAILHLIFSVLHTGVFVLVRHTIKNSTNLQVPDSPSVMSS